MQGKTLAEDLVKCKETPSIVSVIKQTKYRCDSLKDKNTQKLLCKSKWNEGKWVSLRLSKARSSHRRCSVRKGILKNFAKFTGKHLCQSLFFNKVTLARAFSCEFCEISENTFSTEHLWKTVFQRKRIFNSSGFEVFPQRAKNIFIIFILVRSNWTKMT